MNGVKSAIVLVDCGGEAVVRQTVEWNIDRREIAALRGRGVGDQRDFPRVFHSFQTVVEILSAFEYDAGAVFDLVGGLIPGEVAVKAHVEHAVDVVQRTVIISEQGSPLIGWTAPHLAPPGEVASFIENHRISLAGTLIGDIAAMVAGVEKTSVGDLFDVV